MSKRITKIVEVNIMSDGAPPVKGHVYVFKVLLIGEGGVGKTNLRRRYMGEHFVAEYLSTVGADFAYFSEEIEENGEIVTYKWSIWDLAGQPKFSNVRPVFYQGAFGALLCFDITRKETFENLDKWVDELRKNTHTEGTPIVLIATKMDLEDQIQIDWDEVEKYRENLVKRLGDRFEVSLVKTSSLTGLNVKEAFKVLRGSISKWIKEEE